MAYNDLKICELAYLELQPVGLQRQPKRLAPAFGNVLLAAGFLFTNNK
jgi:hypothetical protein